MLLLYGLLDYSTTLPAHDGSRNDKVTLTISNSITDLTFKAVVKELVNSAMRNFQPKTKYSEGYFQTSRNDANKSFTLVVMDVVGTTASAPVATSSSLTLPTQATMTNTSKGPPRTRCKMEASHGAKPGVKSPATSQAMAQLLEVANEATREIDEEEEVEEEGIVLTAGETIKESPELSPFLVKEY